MQGAGSAIFPRVQVAGGRCKWLVVGVVQGKKRLVLAGMIGVMAKE